MVKTKTETVIVAYRFWNGIEHVVGSTKSVVLKRIKVSARKLGLAAKRGSVDVGGGIVVTSDDGFVWTVREVDFLRVSRDKVGKDGNLG